MKRKGDLIFWEIRDLTVSEREMRRLGFEDLIPKNDYESVLLKAVAKEKRVNERIAFKMADGNDLQVTFFVKVEARGEIAVEKEMTVTLNKITGKIKSSINCAAWERIQKEYEEGQGFLNVVQLRRLILNIVQKECYGIAMRSGGGVYFIDARFDKTRDPLNRFFEAFKDRCKLHTVPVYDDNGTVEAIADAAATDVFKDIDAIVDELKERMEKGEITRRFAEGRLEDARGVMSKIKVHRENLADQLKTVETRQTKVEKVLSDLVRQIEDGVLDADDFMAALERL